MWYWDGESCDMCGRCYRFFYEVKNEVWMKINNTDKGCLCLECLIEKANRKGIEIRKADFVDIVMLGTDGWSSETVCTNV